jgi:hypothetical protein
MELNTGVSKALYVGAIVQQRDHDLLSCVLSAFGGDQAHQHALRPTGTESRDDVQNCFFHFSNAPRRRPVEDGEK